MLKSTWYGKGYDYAYRLSGAFNVDLKPFTVCQHASDCD